MTNRTRWMTIVGSVILVGGLGVQAASDGCLRVELVPVKPAVGLGDPVTVDVRVWLDCGPAVKIPGLLEAESSLDVLITGPEGDNIRHMTSHRRIRALKPEFFVELRPSHFFGRRLAISPDHFARVGSYQLQVVFGNDDDGKEAGTVAWTGLAKSNRVTIDVVRVGEGGAGGESGIDGR